MEAIMRELQTLNKRISELEGGLQQRLTAPGGQASSAQRSPVQGDQGWVWPPPSSAGVYQMRDGPWRRPLLPTPWEGLSCRPLAPLPTPAPVMRRQPLLPLPTTAASLCRKPLLSTPPAQQQQPGLYSLDTLDNFDFNFFPPATYAEMMRHGHRYTNTQRYTQANTYRPIYNNTHKSIHNNIYRSAHNNIHRSSNNNTDKTTHNNTQKTTHNTMQNNTSNHTRQNNNTLQQPRAAYMANFKHQLMRLGQLKLQQHNWQQLPKSISNNLDRVFNNIQIPNKNQDFTNTLTEINNNNKQLLHQYVQNYIQQQIKDYTLNPPAHQAEWEQVISEVVRDLHNKYKGVNKTSLTTFFTETVTLHRQASGSGLGHPNKSDTQIKVPLSSPKTSTNVTSDIPHTAGNNKKRPLPVSPPSLLSENRFQVLSDQSSDDSDRDEGPIPESAPVTHKQKKARKHTDKIHTDITTVPTSITVIDTLPTLFNTNTDTTEAQIAITTSENININNNNNNNNTIEMESELLSSFQDNEHNSLLNSTHNTSLLLLSQSTQPDLHLSEVFVSFTDTSTQKAEGAGEQDSNIQTNRQTNTQPQIHKTHTKKYWRIPDLKPGTDSIVLADSNGASLKNFPNNWEVHVFPGAQIIHAHRILEEFLRSGQSLENLVVAVGINNRTWQRNSFEPDLNKLARSILKCKFNAKLMGVSIPSGLPQGEKGTVSTINTLFHNKLGYKNYIKPITDPGIAPEDKYGIHYDPDTGERIKQAILKSFLGETVSSSQKT